MIFEDEDFPLKKSQKKGQKKKKRTNTNVFYNIFQNIIQNFQANPNSKMIIMNIAKENEVQSRPIYDFFNILIYFGVCVKKGGGKIGWVGFNKMYEHFEESYVETEILSINNSMQKIFMSEDSPTLGFLASKIVSLFLFLGIENLNLKDIAILLNGCDYKMQSFERRISLVLHMLVVFGVVTQTNHLREYKILFDPKKYDKRAFSERLKYIHNQPEHFPYSLLNQYESEYIERLRENRKMKYLSLLHSLANPLRRHDQTIIQRSSNVSIPMMMSYANDSSYELPNQMQVEIIS
ncbi:hypothetical protein TRFO_24972 [Tritrichomonas foetus]|uniref:E2F/DP family winged-helix DNA-binding domain-containing protein n=1 Tax=Tritrichomonas foetus TaxID=1144522 RepID=A0A1J4KB58_9EUKA|nr:hypothetical protein TRFO_24972 [Tritrichomonas foetus]|eukprot:OHT06924.1 hypothetical protein TRFO_24972 [Tritrichomonas foetus]